jgi:hypothetical protein
VAFSQLLQGNEETRAYMKAGFLYGVSENVIITEYVLEPTSKK